MDAYIVRQPIMNREQKLEAYEIVYQQDSSTLYNQRDARTALAIITFFSHLGQSNFLEGKDAFLTFTPNLLLQNVPDLFDEKKLVIQIEDNVLVSPETKRILALHKKKGFRFALLDFDFDKRHLDILPMIDIMKVDFTNPVPEEIEAKLQIARQFQMKTGAYNVNTADARQQAAAYDFDYIQGKSVCEMVRTKVHKIDHLQSNFFRLMSAVSCDVPDFDEIARIIALDVTLTFSLIRVVNSAYFALPNRVNDVKQALTILGLGQLKQWIYLLSFAPDGSMSDELIKISFLRATFCQQLAGFVPNLPVRPSSLYLLGMFSTLDALLEISMTDAIKELPLDPEIKQALTDGSGQCGEILQLCIAYENGEWGQANKCAALLGIPSELLSQEYMKAVEYVNDTWNHLTQPFSTLNQ